MADVASGEEELAVIDECYRLLNTLNTNNQLRAIRWLDSRIGQDQQDRLRAEQEEAHRVEQEARTLDTLNEEALAKRFDHDDGHR